MTGDFLVSKIDKLEEIPEKSRILKATVGGEVCIVGINATTDTLGIVLDFETQLEPKFCYENSLFRHEEKNKDITVKGYIEDNCRVRPKNFGERVYTTGFFLPLSCLSYTGDLSSLKEGQQYNEVNGHKICHKYQPKLRVVGNKNQAKKVREIEIPDFSFHFDTAQLFKSVVPDGRFIVSRKNHGTSAIVSRLKVTRFSDKFTKYLPDIIGGYLKQLLKQERYEDIVASRKVIKSVGQKEKEGNSFYETNVWQRAYEDYFKDRLNDNETFYYEICGYEASGKAIQGSIPLKKAKGFIEPEKYEVALEKWGDTVHYSYNNKLGDYSIYVYRITNIVNGEVIDSSWEQMSARCAELGISTVEYLTSGIKKGRDFYFSDFQKEGMDEEKFIYLSENYLESENAPNHIPEGICLSVYIGNKVKTYKVKSQLFRLIECGGKEIGVVDTEEAEESLKDQGISDTEEQN